MNIKILGGWLLLVALLLLSGLPVAAQEAAQEEQNEHLYLPFIANSSSGTAEEASEEGDVADACVPPYTMVNLGALGGVNSSAQVINDHGVILGKTTVAGKRHTVLWKKGTLTDLGELDTLAGCRTDLNKLGQVSGQNGNTAIVWAKGVSTDLGNLGAPWTCAIDLNDLGQIAGYAAIPASPDLHAFRWENGVMTDLGTVGRAGSVTAINELGHVIGALRPNPDQQFEVLWRAGQMTILGSLGLGRTTAYALNDLGQVVGSSAAQIGPTQYDLALHAFLWENGVMTDLNPPGYLNSQASEINNRGHVAGTGTNANGKGQAFFWKRGVMTSLETLGGDQNWVTDMNKRGQVIGGSLTASNEEHAFVWEKGVLTDLGVLEPGGRSVATDINNRGQIAGYATLGGETVAVLWTN